MEFHEGGGGVGGGVGGFAKNRASPSSSDLTSNVLELKHVQVKLSPNSCC